jgi:nitroimidazol reductase NimA-like FMN-containing flavoprotein (pyridoxamine 5'-phosphate oxidase superfamily)
MLICDMNAQECRDLLTRLGVGRLACSHYDQPYMVPVYFAYEPDRLYGFATFGQKIDWMRSNPLVCVEADEVRSHFEWQSVIVLGRYEEYPDTSCGRTMKIGLPVCKPSVLKTSEDFPSRLLKHSGIV